MTTIIFDEFTYANELLLGGFVTRPKWSDLLILAKYYRYYGNKDAKVKQYLFDFCFKFNPEFNEVRHGSMIDYAVKASASTPLRFPMPVTLYQTELEKIHELSDYQLEKILFVMLVISRSAKSAGISLSSDYYINQNFTTILSLSRVFVNKDERNHIKHSFYEMGYIICPEPSRQTVNNPKENFKLLYADETSASSIRVTDFTNIAAQYPFFCTVCGKTMARNSNRHRMCENCWKEKHRKLERERIKNKRNKNVGV